MTTDPVHRLEMRYALVQFFESKKDFAAAQKNIEALYQENPKILGVVRATVDFYWRRNMQQRAVDVLLQAAKDSYPKLRDQFNYEAARKATDAGNYALARQLLDPLLQQSPYDGEMLAAMADTYARQSDSAGLRDFYLAKIVLFRQAPLAPDERTRRIAELRRGLIPALTQLKDYAGAVDQYIEIINQFPEDDGLTSEAALYAEKYGQESRLAAYYAKTVSDSPRDFRWPMVLARLQTQFEDYPASNCLVWKIDRHPPGSRGPLCCPGGFARTFDAIRRGSCGILEAIRSFLSRSEMDDPGGGNPRAPGQTR